jgi:putative ABC transport system substrate-binding protein
MRRRDFLCGVGMVLLALPLHAQRAAGPYRVGIFHSRDDEDSRRFLRAFTDVMKQYGYHDGGNLALAVRYYEGDRKRIPALADELIAWRADVLVANVSSTAAVLKGKTTTIPIVMITAVDAVGEGLVPSLARPGGNITGMTNFGPQVYTKLVELSAELIPGAKRFALLFNPEHSLAKSYAPAASQAAKARGIEVVMLQVTASSALEGFRGELLKSRADALVILTDGTLYRRRDRIMQAANEARLPTIAFLPEFAASGAIATLGYDITLNYRAAARYVDRILKGARPGDLPIEQPTQFQLTLNLKSAKAFGLKIPASVLARADKVIE